MPKRMEAVWRLVGLVYLLTVWPFVIAVGGIAAFLYMIIDVVMQLATGGSGLNRGSTLRRIYDYGYDQFVWIVFGTGEFPIVP